MNQRNPGIGPIRWQDHTHQQMWHMLMAADPAAMFQEAEKATRLADEMGKITDFAHAIVQDVIGSWSGNSADYAAASITDFLKWADHTANTANNIAGLLSQYAHVVNRARLSIPAPVEGQAATPAAADKTHAVHVMEHYTSQSRTIYHELGQHQFAAPPGVNGLPLPAPEPTRQPHPGPPNHPTTASTTPSSDSAATTPSSVTSTVTSTMPSDGAGTLAGPAVTGGMAGGSPGGAAVHGPVGNPGMSAIGAMDAETGMARMAAATAAERAGWGGFAPPPGRATGDQDDEHHDRYSGRPDLIGELPPAFPPVLGL